MDEDHEELYKAYIRSMHRNSPLQCLRPNGTPKRRLPKIRGTILGASHNKEYIKFGAFIDAFLF